jgi:eukaryotic-like serine/threonine-protein kinase
MAESDRADLVGRTIAGKFLILEPIGSGAMGDVYKAKHVSLDSLVAIKIMRSELGEDPMFAERFHREAKAASKLDHPNSIRVVDHGQDGDVTYIAMEFLAGYDLLRVLSDDWPLPFGRIIDIVMQTLAPLAVAHAQGIIHRDLKPENIMVLQQHDDDGNPRDLIKVCDFGIAKILDPRSIRTGGGGMGRALTTTGSLVGTPEYMSPEQARGDALDARSDLYSVGVILYQLLTGRVPFVAETALGVVLKQVSDMPEPPSRHRPDTPLQLEAICMRALRKGVHERYQTAKEMRSELRMLLQEIGGIRVSDESLPMFPSASRIRTGDPTLAAPSQLSPHVASGFTAPVRVASDPNLVPSASTPNLVPSSPTPPFPLTQPAGGYYGTQTNATRNAEGREPRKSSALVVLLSVLGAATLAAAMVLGAQSFMKGSKAPLANSPDAQATELEPIVTDTNGPAKPLPDSSGTPAKSATWPSTKPSAAAATASGKTPPSPSAKPSALAASSPPQGPTTAPTTAPPAPTVEAPAAPYDASRAYIEIGGMVFSSGVSDKAVRSLLTANKSAMLACYQKGLRAKGSAVHGVLTLSLSVGGEGKVRSCMVQGPEIPETSRCVQSVVTGQTLPPSAVEGPGGGTAEATVVLHP